MVIYTYVRHLTKRDYDSLVQAVKETQLKYFMIEPQPQEASGLSAAHLGGEKGHYLLNALPDVLFLKAVLHPGTEKKHHPAAAEPVGEHQLLGGDHPVLDTAVTAGPGTKRVTET